MDVIENFDPVIDDLDRYVAELEGGEELGPTLDRDRANRLLRRLRRLERERGHVVAVARAERDRIEAWERDRCGTIDADVASIERVLDGYMRAVGQRENLRTLKLPNGELRLRPASVRVTVEDEDAFMSWALTRAAVAVGMEPATVAEALAAVRGESLLRTSIEPAKGELRKATKVGPQRSVHEDVELLAAVIKADDAGEVVPGVLIERATGDAFGYSTAKASADELRHDDVTQGGTDDHDD